MTLSDRSSEVVPTSMAQRHWGTHAQRTGTLTLVLAGSLLLYGALFLLLQSKILKPVPTGFLRGLRTLPRVAEQFAPDERIGAVALYWLLTLGLWLLWLVALYSVRPGTRPVRLRWILLGVLALCFPLLLLPGLFSNDLYLYSLYGRVLSVYGENPFLVPPGRFRSDPILPFASYTGLRSGYGPLWVLISGFLSGIAGDGQFANVLAYRLAGAGLHLGATVAVWFLLQKVRTEAAAWGTVFYGWNPLMLFESVGNAHNDVGTAFFVVLALLSIARGHRLVAVALVMVGVMVKAPTLLLLPFFVLALLRKLPHLAARARAGVAAGGVATLTGLTIYAPLWAGTALIDNIRKNPASRVYYNSVWALWAEKLADPGDKQALAVAQDSLDLLRNGALALALAYLAFRLWRGGDLVGVSFWVFFAYCVTLAWIFPWYFVLPVALAAASGPSRAAGIAAALTLGGLLFWGARPVHMSPDMRLFIEYRAFFHFVPAAVAALWLVVWERVTRRKERGIAAGA